MEERTVVLDFDGTLHPFTRGWIGYRPDDEPPVPGSVEFVMDLFDDGYTIVVSSARCDREDGIAGIRRWLDRYYVHSLTGEPLISTVTHTKVPAVAYVDDRAVEFNGTNWSEVRTRVDALAGIPHGSGASAVTP